MKHTTDRTDRAARWIADLTNPSVLSVLLLLLIAFLKSHRPQDAAVWMGVIFALYILIPVGYVYFRMRASGIPSKSIFVLITFLKKHPRDILILSVVLGIPCLVLLILLKAPGILLAPVAALLVGSIVTALFNTFYRVSYHLTALTILAIMTVHTWGAIYLLLVIILPLVFWAKLRIREHTVPQLVEGMAVAAAVCLAVLLYYG
ncbi:MAG: hypothetical protein WBQ62_12315 [Dehalococcoidales bacterium]